MFRSSGFGLEDDPKFLALVKSVKEDFFGPNGPSVDVDFGTIEERAHEAGRALARRICEQAAADQARSADELVACPACERLSSGEVAKRPLQTKDGTIDLAEAKHYCPRCRRAFFPQQSAAAVDASPLQPGDDGSVCRGRKRDRLVRGSRQTRRAGK
jgi:hypothetical protein